MNYTIEIMNNHFGEHLTLDGYGGSFEKLDSQELVLRCLFGLPQELGMTSLSEPQVFRAEPNGKKDPGGWTGFVVIMESHISIHTFPGTGFISVDVYTCKNGMDTQKIINYFVQTFELSDTETNFIIRGKKYQQVLDFFEKV